MYKNELTTADKTTNLTLEAKFADTCLFVVLRLFFLYGNVLIYCGLSLDRDSIER